MDARPAVQRAIAVLADRGAAVTQSDEAWDTLFGAGQLNHN